MTPRAVNAREPLGPRPRSGHRLSVSRKSFGVRSHGFLHLDPERNLLTSGDLIVDARKWIGGRHPMPQFSSIFEMAFRLLSEGPRHGRNMTGHLR